MTGQRCSNDLDGNADLPEKVLEIRDCLPETLAILHTDGVSGDGIKLRPPDGGGVEDRSMAVGRIDKHLILGRENSQGSPGRVERCSDGLFKPGEIGFALVGLLEQQGEGKEEMKVRLAAQERGGPVHDKERGVAFRIDEGGRSESVVPALPFEKTADRRCTPGLCIGECPVDNCWYLHGSSWYGDSVSGWKGDSRAL